MKDCGGNGKFSAYCWLICCALKTHLAELNVECHGKLPEVISTLFTTY